MAERLTPRAWRALGVMGLSAIVMSAAAAYWMRPGERAPAPARGPLPVFVTDWQFADSERGWVLLSGQSDPDGRLYATEDAGHTWRSLAPAAGALGLSFHFFSAAQGELVARSADGSGVLLRTQDGGRSWRTAVLPAVDFAPGELVLGDSAHAYLFADGAVYASADAGGVWSSHPEPAALRPLGFRDARDGWAAVGPRLYRTRDGAHTWSEVELPKRSQGPLISISFTGRAAMLIAGGERGNSLHAMVYPSPDGGETWETPRPAAPDMAGTEPGPPTAFIDHDRWYTPAPATLWSTADAGRTWVPDPIAGGLELAQVRFSDISHGWSLTYRPPTGEPVLLRTSDGGLHWTEVTLPRLG